jgi:hypothetical protein
MEEEVNAWTERVLGPEPVCTVEWCKECQEEKTPGDFKRYDRRSRIFQWLEDEFVKRVNSWVLRWLCRKCGKVVTELPDFALPFKRYVAQTVVDTTAKFLTGTLESMGGVLVVADGKTKAAVTYVDMVEGKARVLGKQMWRKTVTEWCRWLGELEEVLGVAKRLVEPFRKGMMQSRFTYLSQEHGAARDLLEREKEIREHLKTSILTNLIRSHGTG